MESPDIKADLQPKLYRLKAASETALYIEPIASLISVALQNVLHYVWWEL